MGAVKQLFIGQSEDLAREYQISFEVVQGLGAYAKDDDEWRKYCKEASEIMEEAYAQLVDYILWGKTKKEENK